MVEAPSRTALERALVRQGNSTWSPILGQGLRFALSGGIVALVYLALTVLLSGVVGLPFQLALAIGFLTSVSLHFTLQRLFVWRHEKSFALDPGPQAARYLAMCVTQYGVTALSTSQLPRLLGLPVEIVYLATVLLVATSNFLVFRARIFHPARS